MTTEPQWQLLGKCAVDSGTLVVIDPGYVEGATCDELVGPYAKPDDWLPKGLILYRVGPGAQYVRLSNFGGDGTFPVYVCVKDGLVAGVLIAFDADMDPPTGNGPDHATQEADHVR